MSRTGHEGLNPLGLVISRIGFRRQIGNSSERIQTQFRDLFYQSGTHLAVRITNTIKARGLEEAATITLPTEEEMSRHKEAKQLYISNLVTQDRMSNLARTAFLVSARGWHPAYLSGLPNDIGMEDVQRTEIFTAEVGGRLSRNISCIFDFADVGKTFPDDPSYLAPVMAVKEQTLRYTRYILGAKRGEYENRNGVSYKLAFVNGKECKATVFPLHTTEVIHPADQVAIQLLVKQGILPVNANGVPIVLPG